MREYRVVLKLYKRDQVLKPHERAHGIAFTLFMKFRKNSTKLLYVIAHAANAYSPRQTYRSLQKF